MLVLLRLGLLVRVVAVIGAVIAVLAVLLTGRESTGVALPLPGGAQVNVAATGQGAVSYRVTGTGKDGLNVRSCPDVVCAKVGLLREGDSFGATCWQRGAAVSGDPKWLSGTVNGRTGFAAARFLRAEAAVPACDPPPVVRS
ncbi:hypothetical protein [Amycolatopsis anabasis]|uniref:hypothetical protein n=1 Tax=Amycolatopsis anabasis TaxID=1840409 RepID=UPI00131CDB75|nr:hypothetical protein [Amycolatopsis anabasis]